MYGGKIPEFLAESLCLPQGMATGGRWCHMTHLDPSCDTNNHQLQPPDTGREILLKKVTVGCCANCHGEKIPNIALWEGIFVQRTTITQQNVTSQGYILLSI